MTKRPRTGRSSTRRAGLLLVALAVAASLTACSHVMMMVHGTGATRPPAAEFGLGPRLSAGARYTAQLEPTPPLRLRRLQTVRVRLSDAGGRPVDAARITVDGGMPQHGHGLPTRPRMTRALGDGIYEIEGVRFNMGGWWEFRLTIDGATGGDIVTFNLDL